MTIEIHEAAATDLRVLVEFGKLLHDLDMQFAFDDFGSGHARLLELTETSPDYVKFDIALIRGIDHASPRRQQTLGALVRMVDELGIATLGEGIETVGEADTCRATWLRLAQGYLLRPPRAGLAAIVGGKPNSLRPSGVIRPGRRPGFPA